MNDRYWYSPDLVGLGFIAAGCTAKPAYVESKNTLLVYDGASEIAAEEQSGAITSKDSDRTVAQGSSSGTIRAMIGRTATILDTGTFLRNSRRLVSPFRRRVVHDVMRNVLWKADIILKSDEKEQLLQRASEDSPAHSVLTGARPDNNQPALVIFVATSRRRMRFWKLQNATAGALGE
jgi:hypothetical protein